MKRCNKCDGPTISFSKSMPGWCEECVADTYFKKTRKYTKWRIEEHNRWRRKNGLNVTV